MVFTFSPINPVSDLVAVVMLTLEDVLMRIHHRSRHHLEVTIYEKPS